MDLNTVREVVLVRERTELPAWQPGDATVFQQIASTILQTTVDRLRLRQSDTDTSKFDTGAFGSTGTTVTGKVRDNRFGFARLGDIQPAGGGTGSVTELRIDDLDKECSMANQVHLGHIFHLAGSPKVTEAAATNG